MYSAVEHIARSLWLGEFEWSHPMAMYSAYFDDSGHPDSGRYLVVSGCVADVQQWTYLDREWKNELQPLGIDVFHAVDFDKRNPPFDSLTDIQAENLIYRLVGIICRRIEKSFSQALDLDDYKVINTKYVFAECYGFPYPALGRSCMGKVQDWAAAHFVPGEQILFFFENGAKHKGQLEWIAERDQLPRPRFEDKALNPLQTSDLIAWCHNLYLSNGGKIPPMYDRALYTLSQTSNDWGLIDLKDPDRIPTILRIPRRDPDFVYKSVIVRRHGHRRALTHYWPRVRGIEPKLQRKTLVVPDVPPLTLEQAVEASKRYEATKRR